MKNTLIVAVFITLFTSCTTPKLYSWDKYEKTSYLYLKNTDKESIEALLLTYEKIINQQTGTRKVIPPGICADYGYLLMQEGQTEEGKAYLLKEVALYPESKVFIDRILKIIEE